MNNEGGFDNIELSEEEAQIMRFREANQLSLRAAHLGFEMDTLVHVTPAGKELVQMAIDALHNSLIQLMDADLSSPAARDLQVTARAAKLMIDSVIGVLEHGQTEAFNLAEQELEEMDNDEAN